MRSSVLEHLRRHVVGYIALFFALGGATYAAIPDAGNVIHGCYDSTAPVNGAYPLYVIDTSKQPTCPEGARGPMTPLAWNQQGPSGPQGMQGPQGLAGSDAGSGGGSPGPGVPGLGAASQSGPGAPSSAKGKEAEVFTKSAATLTVDKDLTVYCPKAYPVALSASVNRWYWIPGKYEESFQAGLTELYDYVIFDKTMHNVHSARVKGLTASAPEGWTTEWLHLSPNPGGRPWGIELEVNCLTVPSSRKFLSGIVIPKGPGLPKNNNAGSASH
jgi:hypothetical protein